MKPIYPTRKKDISSSSKSLLNRRPARILHRIGVTIIGVWLANILITTVWPYRKQFNYHRYQHKPLQILVIKTKDNKTKGNMRSSYIKNIFILDINNKKPLNIKTFSPNTNISLPSLRIVKTLSDSFNIGGVELVIDSFRESLKINVDSIDRYILITELDSNRIIDMINESVSSKAHSIKIKTKSNSYENSELLKLNSLSQKDEIESFILILGNKLKAAENIKKAPYIIENFLKNVDSNLTYEELFTLYMSELEKNLIPIFGYIDNSIVK